MLFVATYLQPSGPDNKTKYCTEAKNEHAALNTFINYVKAEPLLLYKNTGDDLEPVYANVELGQLLRIVKRTK